MSGTAANFGKESLDGVEITTRSGSSLQSSTWYDTANLPAAFLRVRKYRLSVRWHRADQLFGLTMQHR